MLLFWDDLSTHLSRIILTAGSHGYMLERGVVSLLRLAVRLLSREDMTTQVRCVCVQSYNSEDVIGNCYIISATGLLA